MNTMDRATSLFEALENRTMMSGDLRYAFSLGVKQVDVATDSQGNAYIVGTFKGTVDFNPSPRKVFSMTAANANGDLFIAKFNQVGTLAWVRTLGSASDAPTPVGITVASQWTKASVWITGWFTGTQDFDPTAGTFNMPAVGGKDIFITGLTESGNYIATNRVGSSDDEVPCDITLDGLGRIYVAGPVTGGANTNAVAGQFTAKGRLMGTRTWSTPGVDVVPTALAADGQGDLMMAGDISGPFVFDAGPTGTANGPGAFLMKLDTTGAFAWVNTLASTHINALTTDRASTAGPFSVMAAGDFSGTIDADPDPTTRARLISYGGTDAFVVKYDANGKYLWRASMGGAGNDTATGIDSDAGGSIYVGGLFRQTATFQKASTLTSRGGTDAFAVKYDRAGVQRYLDQFGGAGDDRIDHIVLAIGADIYAVGPLLSAGTYNAARTLTLAPLPGHTEDLFLLRLD